MKLTYDQMGNHLAAQKIALLHGFTQTRRSMHGLISEMNALSTHFSAMAVDAPLHGESQHMATNVSGAADALVETCGKAIYLGYSMGARICLHAALQHPTEVQALVLISGTAGIIDPTQRAHRQETDNELADHVEQVGTQQFIAEWLAKPMFALLPDDPQDIFERCTNSATSLATSLRMCGTGTQQSLWNTLPTLSMPVLLVAGAHDEAFCQHARRMHELIGSNATLRIVQDAGHSVHLEQTQTTAQIVCDWLSTL
jgi:2-succinyl-6-hydroxy-2,4-cyclohexadiene-1-carboxylate synthase